MAEPHLSPPTPPGSVAAVSRDTTHRFSKTVHCAIRLLAGKGVEGDAHAGGTVKHRSRVARDPSQPNLRQVHLIHCELLEALRAAGFDVGPGVLGENITTEGVGLLSLPTGARLLIGASAVVQITGLRNPCRQLDLRQKGLMAAVLGRDANGALERKAGVMGVVIVGGDVRAGDPIAIVRSPGPHSPLEPV